MSSTAAIRRVPAFRHPRRAFDFDRRASGLLLHPTSLPGPHGGGDLGPAAHDWIDFLADARQRWWQMLPVGPPSAPPENGPYGSSSAFAGSVWLISPERLREQGLLHRADLAVAKKFPEHQINFSAMYRHRGGLLRRAFANSQRSRASREPFDAFCRQERSWLDEFALFSALKDRHGLGSWLKWPHDLKLRRPAALAAARRELDGELRFHQFCQFLFDQQWSRLREHSRAKHIGLIGDIPIFIALESADVWANPYLFLLDANGKPQLLSGAPPDAFCPAGQLWGHPQYRWEAHRATRFAWWVARFSSMMRRFDGVRIDHFLGFNRAWGVPGNARTARRGTWLPGPGKALFDAIKNSLGDVPIIAEDLGVMTSAAAALRDECRFPGMRVMQCGFGEGGDYHLPHRYSKRCVAYTGTHDNNTTAGWFSDLAARNGHAGSALSAERAKALQYLKVASPAKIPWEMIRAAMASVADTVIFPIQDVLGLDGAARMNVPGTPDDNWKWRLPPGKLTPTVAARLRRLTELYDRA